MAEDAQLDILHHISRNIVILSAFIDFY